MIALDIYKEMNAKDARKHLGILFNLVDLLGFLIEAPKEGKIQTSQWIGYSESIASKFMFHGLSFHEVLKGYRVKSNYTRDIDVEMFDLHSADVLLRAMVETCLVFRMIYALRDDKIECEFIFNCWMYAGIKGRQSHDASTTFALAQKEKDRKALTDLRKSIEITADKQSCLSKKQVNALLNEDDPKAGRLFMSWRKLAKELGYKGQIDFGGVYSILSRSAHTDALSILRLKGSNPVVNNGNRCFLLQHGCMWVSEFILAWVQLHKVAEFKFNTVSEEYRERVRLYAMVLKG